VGGSAHRWLLPALLAGIALAGCGGNRAAKSPPLPAALARSLAGQADTISRRLDQGDACGARSRALALQQAVIAAINDQRIPAAYEEPLLSDITLLLSRIACVPEPAGMAAGAAASVPSESPTVPSTRLPPGPADQSPSAQAGRLASWLRARAGSG
jgi:hypothetical protein